MIVIPESLQLLPRLAKLITQLQDTADSQHIHTAFGPDAGIRSIARQWELFKQGRKKIGERWVPIDPERKGIVTNAMPQKAPHCPHVDHDGSVGAAACDVWVVINEHPAFKKGDPGYDKYPALGYLGERLGLVWGGRFHSIPGGDLDHFELPNFRELELADV